MLLGIITSVDPEESVEIFEGVAAELYYRSRTSELPMETNQLPSHYCAHR